jgi:uncharacterized protein involved in exopolysaccharide biosynthesis
LGKILYCLATGHPPRAFPLVPVAMLKDPQHAVALTEINEVITRACAVRPEDRFATAEEFDSALAECEARLARLPEQKVEDIPLGSIYTGPDRPESAPSREIVARVSRRRHRPRAFFLRRPKTFLVTFLLVGGAMSYGWVMLRPLYRSSAYLMVDKPRGSPFGQGQPVTEQEYERGLKSVAAIIANPAQLAQILWDPEIRTTTYFHSYVSDAQGFDRLLYNLRDRLEVTVVPGAQLVEVAVCLPNQKDATLFVNKLVQHYAKQQQTHAIAEARSQLDILRDRVTAINKELNAIRNRTGAYLRDRDRSVLSPEARTAQANTIADLTKEIVFLKARMDANTARARALKSDPTRHVPNATSQPSYPQPDDVIAELDTAAAVDRLQLLSVSEELARLENRYRDDSSSWQLMGTWALDEGRLQTELQAASQQLRDAEYSIAVMERRPGTKAFLAVRCRSPFSALAYAANAGSGHWSA